MSKTVTRKDGTTITVYWSETLKQYVTIPDWTPDFRVVELTEAQKRIQAIMNASER